MSSVHHLNTVLADKAVEPPDEAKADFEIGALIVQKLEQRAKEREMREFKSFSGETRSFEGMLERVRPGGLERSQDENMDSNIRAGAASGLLPAGSTLERLRETGYVRWTGWPLGGHGLAQATTIEPDSTFNPFRWHTEDKLPYPTLTRRAQFYIDHEWFMEADEQLPKHKNTPKQGGNYPFRLTSGHNRWSIHSMHMTNNIIMNTHRGEPFVFINDKDAAKKGIENGEEARFFNDVGYFLCPVKVSPAVSPGQLILYNGFEPYMHREWWGEADIEPGMIKWLGLAGGYGHIRYRGGHWQPIPSDRAVHLDVEPFTGASRKNGRKK